MKKFATVLLMLAMSLMMILPTAGKGNDDKLARAEAVSLMRLQRKLARKGIAPNDVKTLRVFEDKDKTERAHTHVRQTHNGVPVFGGEAIVHLDTVTEVEAEPTTDTLVPNVNVSTDPALTADYAIVAAKAKYKEKKDATTV